MAKEKVKLKPLIDEFGVDKLGNIHVFVRHDYKFPAFVKILPPMDEIRIDQIRAPTHIIPAKDENHLDVPSSRVLEDSHRIVFPELKYGFAEVIDPETVLLWFNTEDEAREAERLHG